MPPFATPSQDKLQHSSRPSSIYFTTITDVSPPQKLDDKITNVKTTIYDPAQPIDIIFNSIDNLAEYAISAEEELTQIQTINLALVISNNQWIFKDDIRAWKRTNQAYKTWDNFKHDFRKAQLELRETGCTIDELGFHNANAIVDQMMVRLQVDKDERTDTSTQHATALASTNQSNSTMELQMQTLLVQVQALQLYNTPNHGSNYGRGRSRGAGRGRGCAQPSAQHTPKYCWTHGNFNNSSEECTYTASGHKKE